MEVQKTICFDVPALSINELLSLTRREGKYKIWLSIKMTREKIEIFSFSPEGKRGLEVILNQTQSISGHNLGVLGFRECLAMNLLKPEELQSFDSFTAGSAEEGYYCFKRINGSGNWQVTEAGPDLSNSQGLYKKASFLRGKQFDQTNALSWQYD